MSWSAPDLSLYSVLDERAPATAPAGETINTRRKETVDNDAEAFDFDIDAHRPGAVYAAMSSAAPAAFRAGETRITKTVETVDEEPALHEMLADAAPAAVASGETRITATKETVDDDAEVVDDDILQL